MTTYAFTRAVTIFAVGFLALNATLLYMTKQHYVWATVFAVGAVLGVIGWFWYRRTVRELVDAKKEMKREVESIRQLLHTHRQN